MKIGLVVDGEAEYASMPCLYAQLRKASRHEFLNPLKADIQPLAPVGAIAERCEKAARQLLLRGADRVIVLIDRESRGEAPGVLASAIASHVEDDRIVVVIKNRMFENWLIADLDALVACRARFAVARATRRAVERGKADNIDGLGLLKRTTVGDYHKVLDAKRILGKAAVGRMGTHSRSFRRFLRCSGDPTYAAQSRLPADSP